MQHQQLLAPVDKNVDNVYLADDFRFIAQSFTQVGLVQGCHATSYSAMLRHIAYTIR